MLNQKRIDLRVTFDPETGECKVAGPVNCKAGCIAALAEAIKCVVMHEPPAIIVDPAAGRRAAN